MILFFLGLMLAKDACVSGSSECIANTLRVCGIKNQWVYVDCPTGTECSVRNNEIACIPADKSALMDRKDPVNGLDALSPHSEPDDEHSGNEGGADGRPGVKRNSMKHSSVNISNESGEHSEDVGKKRTRTITRTLSPSRESKRETVTVMRTVVQKQTPTEIKLEYASKDSVEPNVARPASGSSSDGAGGSSSGSAPSHSPPSGPSQPGASSELSGSSGPSGNPSSPGSQSPSDGMSAPEPSNPPTGSPSGSGQPGSPPSSGEPSPSQPSKSASVSTSSGSPASIGERSQSPTSTVSRSSPGKQQRQSKPSDPKSGSQAPQPSGGASKGALNITADQVVQAMKQMSFSPNADYVKAMVSKVNAKIKDLNEAAMLLAQCGHESGGYQHIEEIACAGKVCSQYGMGAPGKSYHGRGFIQLSLPANYKAASQALGLGDELYNTPEKVSEDPNLGADVSIWFWMTNVANVPGVKENHFGAATKAINGELECKGGNTAQSKKRYDIYKALVKTLNISNPADESGCYS